MLWLLRKGGSHCLIVRLLCCCLIGRRGDTGLSMDPVHFFASSRLVCLFRRLFAVMFISTNSRGREQGCSFIGMGQASKASFIIQFLIRRKRCFFTALLLFFFPIIIANGCQSLMSATRRRGAIILRRRSCPSVYLLGGTGTKTRPGS
jgi:hypothetical protein